MPLPEKDRMRQMGFGSGTTIAMPEIDFDSPSRFQRQPSPPRNYFTPVQRRNFDAQPSNPVPVAAPRTMQRIANHNPQPFPQHQPPAGPVEGNRQYSSPVASAAPVQRRASTTAHSPVAAHRLSQNWPSTPAIHDVPPTIPQHHSPVGPTGGNIHYSNPNHAAAQMQSQVPIPARLPVASYGLSHNLSSSTAIHDAPSVPAPYQSPVKDVHPHNPSPVAAPRTMPHSVATAKPYNTLFTQQPSPVGPVNMALSTPATPQSKSPKSKKLNGQTLLFAARRNRCPDSTYLVLVNPKSGRLFIQNEVFLNAMYHIQFGDFMYGFLKDDVELVNFKKMTPGHMSSSPKTINGDCIEHHQLKGTVQQVRSQTVVRSQHFADAIVHENAEVGKECTFSIRLLQTPRILSTGEDFSFEAFNVSTSNNNPAVSPIHKINVASPVINYNTGGTSSPIPAPSAFPIDPIQQSNRQSAHCAAWVGTQDFSALDTLSYSDPQPEISQSSNNVMKTFVESREIKPNGDIVHRLWVCDIAQKALFKSSQFSLKIGHFFEGELAQKKSGAWECRKYVNEIDPLMEGHLENGKIVLISKVIRCLPGTGKKYTHFRHIFVKHIGEVIDYQSLLSRQCVGKTVEIRRHVFDQQAEWVVSGVMP